MKISYVGINNDKKEKIKESFEEVEFFNNIEDVEDTDILSVFVDTIISRDDIERMKSLKMIATRSTGYDHVDRTASEERNIIISNVPTYGSRTVAEFTFSLILALSRNAYASYDELKNSGKCDCLDHFEGFDLVGKTLGVIGTGAIGRNVIKIATGFGMKVIAYDVYPDDATAVALGFEYVSLEEVVSTSDIVTLHVPYCEATHHLINEELLSKFKKGSYLINTARGEVIDTKALLSALNDDVLAGAGLDVLEGERELGEELDLLNTDIKNVDEFKILIADHKLIDMKNVIVTPHIAFNTVEAKAEIQRVTVENIKSFINNSPTNLIK